MEIVDWADQNSKGIVTVKMLMVSKKEDNWVVDIVHGNNRVFFGFDNSDDALYFRIKYGNL